MLLVVYKLVKGIALKDHGMACMPSYNCVCVAMCVYVCVCACDREYVTVYLSDFVILMIIEVGEWRYQSTTNLEFQIRLQLKYQIFMLLAHSTFVIIESPMLVIQGIF